MPKFNLIDNRIPPEVALPIAGGGSMHTRSWKRHPSPRMIHGGGKGWRAMSSPKHSSKKHHHHHHHKHRATPKKRSAAWGAEAKMNPWIAFVKMVQDREGISYKDALKMASVEYAEAKKSMKR